LTDEQYALPNFATAKTVMMGHGVINNPGELFGRKLEKKIESSGGKKNCTYSWDVTTQPSGKTCDPPPKLRHNAAIMNE
jgi:hypothetical protein